MLFKNKNIQPAHKIRIPKNVLLHASGPTRGLYETLMGKPSSVSEKQVKDIHLAYGESGLFKLLFLDRLGANRDFDHFFQPIIVGLDALQSVSAEVDLECDNDKLRQSEELARFNSNVIMPSLSRKLFNPGCGHGYMVYGFGGPRILVSHPFQGVSRHSYEVYNNSVDVVTSLMARGYVGTFLFLDNMGGLNYEVEGVPAWLLWFSLIASQSDLILFVKEYESDFARSQKMEIEFTPDRVHKKIVEIPHDELTWAKKVKDDHVEHVMYLGGGKGRPLTKEEWYEVEAKQAAPFIEEYASPYFPKDTLIRIYEDELTEYPLDYPLYGSKSFGS